MITHRRAAAVSLAVALLAVPAVGLKALAHEYKAGGVMVGHPWSRATVPGARVGGGFLTIENTGDKPDRLVSVQVPFAEKTEIHESSVEEGVAKMREIEGGVEVKPGDTVAFAPGGKHLMFVGLKAPLTKGQKVKGELTFETAGKVEVEFEIEAAGAKPAQAMDHGMKGGDMKDMDHK